MLVHKHLLVKSHVLRPPTSAAECIEWLGRLVKHVGMEILHGPHAIYCDKEGNEGVTGIVVLSTSHSAIHVWDREEPHAVIHFDLYSCADFTVQQVMELFNEFEPMDASYKFLDRDTGFTVLEES